MNPPGTVLDSLFFWLQGIRSAGLTCWAGRCSASCGCREGKRSPTQISTLTHGSQGSRARPALRLGSGVWIAWFPTLAPYLLPSPHWERCIPLLAAQLTSASICQSGNVRQLAARGVIFPVYITGGSGLRLSFSRAFSCSASDVRDVKCGTFPTVRLVVSACVSPWGGGRVFDCWPFKMFGSSSCLNFLYILDFCINDLVQLLQSIKEERLNWKWSILEFRAQR